MDENICEQIIEEIKNLPVGTTFAIKEFLDKHNIDFSLYLKYSLTIIGQIREFVKGDEKDKGISGLPYNYKYIKK